MDGGLFWTSEIELLWRAAMCWRRERGPQLTDSEHEPDVLDCREFSVDASRVEPFVSALIWPKQLGPDAVAVRVSGG